MKLYGWFLVVLNWKHFFPRVETLRYKIGHAYGILDLGWETSFPWVETQVYQIGHAYGI